MGERRVEGEGGSVVVGGRGGRLPVRHECYTGQCHFSHAGEREIERAYYPRFPPAQPDVTH